MICNFFQNGNLYAGRLCELSAQPQERGEGRELPPTTAWRQFPVLLSAPAVEPIVISCNTGNRDSKEDQSWEHINSSQMHECRHWERGRAV